jgi:hypothetical protein
MRKITVGTQTGQIVHGTLSRKNPPHKKRADRVAQGVDPKFKPQYVKKTQKNKKIIL